MNEDFVAENKDRLMKKEDLIKAWEITVQEWNNAQHGVIKGKTRNEVYQMPMPIKEELSFLEIASMMWVAESKRQITYKRDGITMNLAGTDYAYEVYDYNSDIDLEFRRINVGKKFIVRYNPEYLDSYVQLFQKSPEGQMALVAVAQPKRTHESIPVLMSEGQKAQWWKDFQTQEIELNRDQKAYQDLVQRTGISREAMILEQELKIKMGGNISKTERSLAESHEYDF
jgi:hypothetical protein